MQRLSIESGILPTFSPSFAHSCSPSHSFSFSVLPWINCPASNHIAKPTFCENLEERPLRWLEYTPTPTHIHICIHTDTHTHSHTHSLLLYEWQQRRHSRRRWTKSLLKVQHKGAESRLERMSGPAENQQMKSSNKSNCHSVHSGYVCTHQSSYKVCMCGHYWTQYYIYLYTW